MAFTDIESIPLPKLIATYGDLRVLNRIVRTQYRGSEAVVDWEGLEVENGARILYLMYKEVTGELERRGIPLGDLEKKGIDFVELEDNIKRHHG